MDVDVGVDDMEALVEVLVWGHGVGIFCGVRIVCCISAEVCIWE